MTKKESEGLERYWNSPEGRARRERMSKAASGGRSGSRKSGGGLRTATRDPKRKKPVRKVGILELVLEGGGLVIGASTAAKGDLTTGVVTAVGGMVAGHIVRKVASRSELHKIGYKIGRNREIVIA